MFPHWAMRKVAASLKRPVQTQWVYRQKIF
jgi:hypothetical protein